MGKVRTTVNTSVSRVITDDVIPNSVEKGVLRALFREGEVVDEVLEELIGSLGARAERLYDWAERGNYVHGMPSGQFANGQTGADEIKAVLDAIEGAPVTLDYFKHGPPNTLHIGWLALQNDYGYNPATNELATLTGVYGSTAWLHDMRVVIPSSEAAVQDPSTLAQYGIAAKAGYAPSRTLGTDITRAMIKPTVVQVDPAASEEHLYVIFSRIVAGAESRGDFIIPLAAEGYDDLKDYFMVRYIVGGVAKYWIYEDGLGTYPTLDQLYDLPEEPNGTFFPFLYYRYEKDSEVDDTSTEAYRDGKKLAKYLGMDYDAVGEGINENPDIADVEQAMVMFAVPANTVNPLERRYLFTFFENLYNANPVEEQFGSQAEIDIYGYSHDKLYVAAPSIVIKDSRFKMQIDCEGIYKKLVAGSIGDVGDYDSGFTTTEKTVTVNDLLTLDFGQVTSPVKLHYFRKQVSTGFYEEIQVLGLKTVFWVFQGWTTLGDDEDAILLIPVDHSITNSWSLPNREILYSRSLHYVFNSLIQTKVKWYQTGIFQVVMIVVMIVIAFYTWGSTLAEIGALLAAGAYVAAALIILEMIVTMLIAQLVFKLVVKLVGVEFAFILAIAAAMYGAYGQMGGPGFGVAGAPWAGQLLTISSGLTQAIGNQIKADTLDLVNQAKEFELYKADQLKILQTGQELLDTSTRLDPFVIFGEKPGDYYNRTVHSGNIGVTVGIGSISSFVDVALSLPKLSNSLEGASI